MDDFTAFLLGVASGTVLTGALLWWALTKYLTRGDQ